LEDELAVATDDDVFTDDDVTTDDDVFIDDAATDVTDEAALLDTSSDELSLLTLLATSELLSFEDMTLLTDDAND
jgi:hypothetical protein